MKKHLSKRLLSLFLAVLMLASSVPLVAYAKSTEWTQVASTNFVGASFDKAADGSDVTSASDVEAQTTEKFLTNAPTVDSGDQALSWSTGSWQSVSQINANGLYVPDGFVYLSGYSGASGANYTPITGAEAFKIDLGFYRTSESYSDSSRYGFFLMGTGTPYTHQKTSMTDSSYAFAQDVNGDAYINGTSVYSNDSAYNLSATNGRLSASEEYHYIISYSKNYFRAYITDSDYEIVQTMFARYIENFDTSRITSIQFGDDDGGDYIKGITYTSVKFYTGVEAETENAMKDTSRDKYLFAYFTGQNDAEGNGEKIRLAVSDDGLNYEALNGNDPMLNNTPNEYYPSNGASTGKAASGAARDPFIIQARNEDGSVGTGYYILATDLRVDGDDYTNSKFLFWYLEDITDVDTVQPWSVETTGWFGRSDATDFYAWAPEAIWDDEMNMYMLYWSTGGTLGYNDICLHYAYTSDFKTFYNKDMQELGTTVDGSVVMPQKLINPYWGTGTGDNKNIDGNITYDGNLYWLYFKHESQQQIYYCHAESPSGPYSGPVQFVDSDFTSGLEGCEVFQLNDGTYVLMMDHYTDNGNFLMYTSTTLNGFEGNMIETSNINHLSPRHGAVTYITTAEYNALAEKFGKSTYDADGILDGTDVNDYLVARYFTNSNVTEDATGHGYTLTNVGATATSQDGRAAAQFVSNGATASNLSNGDYAYVSMSQMYQDYNLNEKDGITLDWYASASALDNSRFFDISNANIGQLTWDTRYDMPYAYYSSKNEFGVSGAIAQSWTNTTNVWHHYTVTITHNYMNVYVDGVLQRTTYNADGSVNRYGSPMGASITDETFFDTAVGQGYLRFSASVFSGDVLLDGYISDFRIYSKALSQNEITTSINALTASDTGADVGDNEPAFYDPMEDTEDGKTRYDATVNDSLHGDVLNMNGGVATHNPIGGYAGRASDTGYTISMWYNPGATISGKTVFNIGRSNDFNGSNRQYFELLENGTLYYNWEVSGTPSYVDLYGVFGDASLVANEWTHIVIQVVPDGDYDIFNIYFNGHMVNSIDVFAAGNNYSGRAAHDYFAQSHDVSYGLGCNYWASSSEDEFIDDFAIYAGLYNAQSIYRKDSLDMASQLLEAAISEYEEKMARIATTGVVYTNMLDAYKAYDRVVRYRDAVQYGEVESNVDYIIQLYDELVNVALPNMEEYTKPATREGLTPSEAGTTNNVDAAYTNNLLSPVTLNIKREQEGLTQDNGNAAIYSSAFTWLYTGEEGDAPTAPIVGGVYTTISAWNNGIRFYSISVSDESDKVSLQDWCMTTNVPDNGVSYSYNADSTNMSSSYGVTNKYIDFTIGGFGGYGGFLPDRTTWYYGSSYLTYNGTMADDQYITTFTPNYMHRYYCYWPINQNETYQHQITGYPITVINFVPAKNALAETSKHEVLANITDYNPDVVEDLLTRYDNLTGLNYILNSTADAATLAAEEEKYVNELNNAVLPDLVEDKKADYTEAINAVDNESTNYNERVESGEYLNFTASSWQSYEKAYNAVTEHFASLDPFGADMPYATSQDYVQNFIDNLASAASHLVVKADYSSVESDCAPASEYTATIDTENIGTNSEQLYTYSTWVDFDAAYGVAEVWAGKPIGFKNNTPMYEMEFSPYDGTGGATEGQYPYIAVLVNDEDGSYSVVTDISMIRDEQYADQIVYMYYQTLGLNGFYENQNDEKVTQFETGEWILLNGEWINLNGCRFAPSTVPVESNLSTYQNSINTADTNVQTTHTDLVAPADYTAYNATTELLKYQDIAAFTDDYIANNLGEVFAKISEQGTQDAQVTYASGLEGVSSKTIETPAYVANAGEKAYVVDAQGTVWKDTSAQGTLDSNTSYILQQLQLDNTTDTSARRIVSVTYNFVVGDSGAETLVEQPTVYYGDSYTATAPEGYTVYKWVITGANGSVMTVPSADSYTALVTDDVTITAYCSETPAENQVSLKVYNQYNHLVQEYNVANDAQITLNGDSYVVTGFDAVSAMPPAPFYSFGYWTVNGAQATGNTINVADYADSSEILLRPVYVVDEAVYNITVDGEVVNLESGSPIVYDSVVSIKPAENAIGLAVYMNGSFYAVSYGTDAYTFFAAGDMSFYSIYKNEDGSFTINGTPITSASDYETYRKLDGRLPFVYSISRSADGIYYTYSASTFNIPEGAVVTEVGTLYTINAAVANENDFVIGADGVYAISAKNQLDTMQYWFGINNHPQGNTIYTRAYVKYSFTTGVDEGNINQGTEIQTVDYGNICSN